MAELGRRSKTDLLADELVTELKNRQELKLELRGSANARSALAHVLLEELPEAELLELLDRLLVRFHVPKLVRGLVRKLAARAIPGGES